jgi:hypothetical protein
VPGSQPLDAAVGRQRGMIHNDLRRRKISRQESIAVRLSRIIH